MNNNNSQSQVTRRDFLKLGVSALSALAVLEIGGASLMFMKPRSLEGAFGGVVYAGAVDTFTPGSVVHFQADVLYENLLCAIEERPFTASYDGHSNCYIETGFGKGALIDFNYDTEPLPGMFPLPGLGPFGLLKETRLNHYGKLMFRWIYWHILLKGKEMPIDSKMTMAGKKM